MKDIYDENQARFAGETERFEVFVDNSLGEKTFDEINQIELQESIKKYIPIGSVVTFLDSFDLKMIVGYNYVDDNRMHDYLVCDYPFGVAHNKPMSVFDHSEIRRIYHIGYVNEHQKKHKKELNNNLKK